MYGTSTLSISTSVGFTQLLIDECVFYRDDVIIVYVDDGLFLGPSDHKLTTMIEALKMSRLKIEDQGHPSDYIGINIKKHPISIYEFLQLALIDSILGDVCLTNSSKVKPVPMSSSKILHTTAQL